MLSGLTAAALNTRLAMYIHTQREAYTYISWQSYVNCMLILQYDMRSSFIVGAAKNNVSLTQWSCSLTHTRSLTYFLNAAAGDVAATLRNARPWRRRKRNGLGSIYGLCGYRYSYSYGCGYINACGWASLLAVGQEAQKCRQCSVFFSFFFVLFNEYLMQFWSFHLWYMYM